MTRWQERGRATGHRAPGERSPIQVHTRLLFCLFSAFPPRLLPAALPDGHPAKERALTKKKTPRVPPEAAWVPAVKIPITSRRFPPGSPAAFRLPGAAAAGIALRDGRTLRLLLSLESLCIFPWGWQAPRLPTPLRNAAACC